MAALATCNKKTQKEETMKEGILYDEVDFTRSPSADKVKLILGKDYEIKEENGEWYAIKKQPQYPKTYKECCMVLDVEPYGRSAGYKSELITAFRNLLICRDAYWKIAGDWKPDWENFGVNKYCISTNKNRVDPCNRATGNKILAFPTKEMRDAFYENFKELIDSCKELL